MVLNDLNILKLSWITVTQIDIVRIISSISVIVKQVCLRKLCSLITFLNNVIHIFHFIVYLKIKKG